MLLYTLQSKTLKFLNANIVKIGSATHVHVRAWLSDEEYASLSQAHSRLLWYYKDCGEGVFTTVKTDNLIEEKCRQYIKEFKDDLQHSSQRI